MAENIREHLRRLLSVPPGKGKPVFLFWLYFFLVITSYYLIKPVRDGLFLEHLGSGMLPWFYLLNTGLGLLVVCLYNQVRRRIRAVPFIQTIGCALILVFFGFRFLFGTFPALAASLFHSWASVYNLVVVLMFWSFADDFFSLDEGKRFFGFIGTGGVLGGVVGGWLAGLLAEILGSANLLIVSSGVLFLGLVVVQILGMAVPSRRGKGLADDQEGEQLGSGFGFASLYRSPYLRLIAVVVTLTMLCTTLLNLQFNRGVELAGFNGDELTSFFGSFYAWMNASALGLQVLVVGPVNRRFGPLPGLAVLPLICFGVFADGLFAASFSVLVLGYGAALSVLSSLNQSSRELLFIPLGIEEKYRAKAFIDVVFFRLGDSLAALAQLLLVSTALFGAAVLQVLGILVSLGWLITLRVLQRQTS